MAAPRKLVFVRSPVGQEEWPPALDPSDNRVMVGGMKGFSLRCEICGASWFATGYAEVEYLRTMMIMCDACTRDLILRKGS